MNAGKLLQQVMGGQLAAGRPRGGLDSPMARAQAVGMPAASGAPALPPGMLLPPPPTTDARATADPALPPAGSDRAEGLADEIRGLQHALQAQQRALPTPDVVDTHPWEGAPTQGTTPEWLSRAGQGRQVRPSFRHR